MVRLPAWDVRVRFQSGSSVGSSSSTLHKCGRLQESRASFYDIGFCIGSPLLMETTIP